MWQQSDNLEEMDKFLKTYNLPKLNQEESENLNRQITISEIEVVTKKLPINKSPGPDGSSGEIYQTVKELTLIRLTLFHKIQEVVDLPSSFYKVSIILNLKLGKGTQREN